MVDWLNDSSDEVYCADSEAFENFFHDFCLNGKAKGAEWGPDYWEQHGIKVVNSRVEYDTPAHRTMFLLRWL
jgi:hypothetical protein